MKIRFLGAAGDVTGSAYQVVTKDASILVDCGFFQGRKIVARRAFSEQIKQRFGAQTDCPALDDVIEI